MNRLLGRPWMYGPLMSVPAGVGDAVASNVQMAEAASAGRRSSSSSRRFRRWMPTWMLR